MGKLYFYRSSQSIYILGSLEDCISAKNKLNWLGYEVMEIVDAGYYLYRENILKTTDVFTELEIWSFWINKDSEDITF